MKIKHRNDFFKLMAKLAMIFEIDLAVKNLADLTDAYFEAFKSIPFDHITRGVDRTIRTRRYRNFPLPAEIIELAETDADHEAELSAENGRQIKERGKNKRVVSPEEKKRNSEIVQTAIKKLAVIGAT